MRMRVSISIYVRHFRRYRNERRYLIANDLSGGGIFTEISEKKVCVC